MIYEQVNIIKVDSKINQFNDANKSVKNNVNNSNTNDEHPL